MVQFRFQPLAFKTYNKFMLNIQIVFRMLTTLFILFFVLLELVSLSYNFFQITLCLYELEDDLSSLSSLRDFLDLEDYYWFLPTMSDTNSQIALMYQIYI